MNNLLKYTITCVVGILALEGMFRIFDDVPLLSTINIPAYRINLLRTQTANDYDPLLGWVLKANMAEGSGENTFSTGRFGQRLSIPNEQQPERYSIIASGDSFTAGSEVTDNSSWPAQLQTITEKSVANVAAGGWGADQIVLRALQINAKMNADIVIISFLYDDMERAGFSTYGAANKPWFDNNMNLHNNPVPKFTGTPQEIGWRGLAGHSAIMDRLGSKFDPTWAFGTGYKRTSENFNQISCQLLKMVQSTRLNKQTIFLLQWGGNQIKQWSDEPKAAHDIIECAQAAGMITIDLWEPLKSALVNDKLVDLYVMHDKAYGHMSKEGNKLVANFVAKAINSP